MKIFRLLSVPILLAAFHGPAKADVTLGSSMARDITATATITGNLGLTSIGTNNITAGPVNEADGTASPRPDQNPPLVSALSPPPPALLDWGCWISASF